MDDDLHPIVSGFIGLMVIGASLYGAYCTLIAFLGGTVIPFGWKFEGSVSGGIVWMIFGTPLISAAMYVLMLLVALPLSAIFKRK